MTINGDLLAFPYPFADGDAYRYSNNAIPLNPPIAIELTESYLEEINLRRELLTNHPERCYHSMPHTMDAQWEVLDLILHQLASSYPENYQLVINDNHWIFTNHLTGENHSFDFGDQATMDIEPLDFVGRHVQEDLILMMQRDGDLFLDAGQLCFPANWSLYFDAGMSFKEIHTPIPGFKSESLDERILQFLMRIEAGSPWWRKNWSLMAGERLDTSLETFAEWGQARKKVTKANAGELANLRVEVQKLFRLPKSNGILFTIHTHMLPLGTFIQHTPWLKQFSAILKELPEFIAEYKGISLYRHAVLEYLEEELKKR
ncbi:heme-dependent oxidative N-demethylase family protein [Mesobacillus thioparans]|uniref:heme-dependent oxidative N-demethylase family protein n=1 Tax=Mesobacillus thioparans TaxID=370439 RepID=UPI0039EF530C